MLCITLTVEHNYISLSTVGNTTTCFGPIGGPSSGCNLDLEISYTRWVGGNEISLFLDFLAAKWNCGSVRFSGGRYRFWMDISASLELLRHVTVMQRYCHAYLFILDLCFCKCIIFYLLGN